MAYNPYFDFKKLKNPDLIKSLIEAFSHSLSMKLGQSITIKIIESGNHNELFARAYDIHKSLYPDSIEQNFKMNFQNPVLNALENNLIIFVFSEDEDLAYCQRYKQDDVTELGFDHEVSYEAAALAVKRKYQGVGIGPGLMALSIVIAHQLGYKLLYLWCVETDPSGRDLVEYYSKLGFSKLDKERRGQKLMSMNLNRTVVNKAIERLRL